MKNEEEAFNLNIIQAEHNGNNEEVIFYSTTY
jgi:hypothetical protein